MRVKIYQITDEKDKRNLKFASYDKVKELGGIDPGEYKCVFKGDIDAKSLDDVYTVFNEFNDPYLQTFQGRSLSNSDVVEIVGDVPDICGKIEYLYPNKDGNATVGEWKYFDDKEKFDKEVMECVDDSVCIRVEYYDTIRYKLAREGFYFCDVQDWVKVDFDSSQCEDMDGIRSIMLNPERKPVETRLINDLAHLQKAVSLKGEESYIEVTYPFEDTAIILGNEEAKLEGMEGNRRIEGSVFAGPIYILNDSSEGEFCDLTDEQVEKYSKMFENPEKISKEEVEADCGFEVSFW